MSNRWRNICSYDIGPFDPDGFTIGLGVEGGYIVYWDSAVCNSLSHYLFIFNPI